MRTLYNLVKQVSNYGLTYLYFYTMMHWFDIQLHSDTQPHCSVALTVTTERTILLQLHNVQLFNKNISFTTAEKTLTVWNYFFLRLVEY